VIPLQSPAAMKKVLMGAAAAGTLGVLAFWYLAGQGGQFVSAFSHYYPEQTGFYLEFKPSDKLANRAIQTLEQLYQLNDSQTSAALNTLNLSDVFQKDFEPEMTVGVWAPKDQPAAAASLVMALKTKPSVTLEALQRDLKLPAAYQRTEVASTPALVNADQADLVVALDKQAFLIANSRQALAEAFSTRDGRANLIDNAGYKKALALAPKTRQGTVVFQAELMKAMMGQAPNANPNDPFQALQRAFDKASPVTVGSIQVADEDQKLVVDTFTPVSVDKIDSESLRKDLVSLYSEQSHFDLAALPEKTSLYIGTVGLSKYYQLFVTHFATPEIKRELDQMATQLKALGLDWDKNIIAFFDKQASLGLMMPADGAQTPEVTLSLNHTADTQKTIEQLAAMLAATARGQLKDQQLDDQAVLKVIQSPFLPVQLAYFVPPKATDALLLGTQHALEATYGASKGKAATLGGKAVLKQLTGDFPAQLNSVYWVDLASALPWLDKLAGQKQLAGTEAKAYSTLKSLVASVEGLAGWNRYDNAVLKSHVVLLLKKS
jgi:hypothetical protein